MSFFCFYRTSLKLIFPFFLFILLSHSVAQASDRKFETWTSIGAETEFRNTLLTLENANFFLPNGDWYLNFSQFTFHLPLKYNFRFGLGYKQEYVKTPEKLRTEYRPMVQLFYIKTFGVWNFSNRNRWEFRCMEGDLINRYRNQMRISYLKFKKIAPYCSTESFFYFNDFRFNRQRSFIGANIFVSKIIFDFYLGNQISEKARQNWENDSMLGTSLTYSF